MSEKLLIERLKSLAEEVRGPVKDAMLDAAMALTEADALAARLAEAIECCTIKDNRNLWLEIRLKKIMARCADLLDEDQFNELDAIARATDSASAVQPERCCLDYPRCDCNSPPEPEDAPTLQPCGHPWKAQHDFKCILCSSPGTAQEKANE